MTGIDIFTGIVREVPKERWTVSWDNQPQSCATAPIEKEFNNYFDAVDFAKKKLAERQDTWTAVQYEVPKWINSTHFEWELVGDPEEFWQPDI